MLRAIYVFHRLVRGWHDIGYNFALDRFGRVFEARAGGIDEAVVGAHAGGYNTCSTGVAMLGTYMQPSRSHRRRPGLAAAAAVVEALAPRRRRPGPCDRSPSTPPGAIYSRYPGRQRSLAAAYRRTPRRGLHRLPRGRPLRRAARDPHPLPTPSPAPPCRRRITTSAGELLGTLTLLDGTPLAGQPVTLQARSVSRRGEVVAENPVAQVVTDAEGQWTLPGAPAAAPAGGRLRALFAGAGSYGAAVSEAIPARLAAAAPLPATRRRAERRLAPALGCGRLPVRAARSGRPLAQPLVLALGQPVRRGSVATSSVGLLPAAAQPLAGVVEAVVHPRQRPPLRRSARSPRASSARRAFPGSRSKLRYGSPAGRPSSRGRCSSARSSQPLAHTRLVQLWPAQAGVRPPWPKGNGPCRRPRAGSPAACRESSSFSGTPNSEMTPSMSTIKSRPGAAAPLPAGAGEPAEVPVTWAFSPGLGCTEVASDTLPPRS